MKKIETMKKHLNLLLQKGEISTELRQVLLGIISHIESLERSRQEDGDRAYDRHLQEVAMDLG